MLAPSSQPRPRGSWTQCLSTDVRNGLMAVAQPTSEAEHGRAPEAGGGTDPSASHYIRHTHTCRLNPQECCHGRPGHPSHPPSDQIYAILYEIVNAFFASNDTILQLKESISLTVKSASRSTVTSWQCSLLLTTD
ncbi:hypothetical protein GQ55_2G142300 [Panicum hallii var. hallii]|uniref:Uncharacterized protein n=1 Tax=Panicum hallii var. hallii TaxID=1504633 RepID=A0A2T7EPR4_9POAL|nr:hypothetical protein GQ55_2G142300 [Panicum hallii var. hallii]